MPDLPYQRILLILSKVRVRFYFASNADNADTTMNGFGFDNVFIGEKRRTVLVENFTNSNQAQYSLANDKMTAIKNSLIDEDMLYINYHISDGNPDQFNRDNDDAPRIRSAKYGLSNSLHSIMDGSATVRQGFSGFTLDQEFNSFLVDSRSLITPPFNIENISISSTAENIIEVNYDLSNNLTINRPIRIYTLVMEEDIVAGGLLGFNVVKKMMPDATGLTYDQNWPFNPSTGVGTTIPLANVLESNGYTGETSLKWDLNNEQTNYIYNPSNLSVVVFIQDQETNEVFQAAFENILDDKQPNNITSIEDELIGELTNITVFPNPVLMDMNFVLEDEAVLSRDDYYWKLIDQRGLTMLEGDLLFRNGRISISTEDVPNGMYHLVMGLTGKPMIYRKIAIMHR